VSRHGGAKGVLSWLWGCILDSHLALARLTMDRLARLSTMRETCRMVDVLAVERDARAIFWCRNHGTRRGSICGTKAAPAAFAQWTVCYRFIRVADTGTPSQRRVARDARFACSGTEWTTLALQGIHWCVTNMQTQSHAKKV
jgi:hypothetical protein